MADFLEDVLGPQVKQADRKRVAALDPFRKARVRAAAKQEKLRSELQFDEFNPLALEEAIELPEDQGEDLGPGLEETAELRFFTELQQVFGPDYIMHPFAQQLIEQFEQDQEEQKKKTKVMQTLGEMRGI